MEFNLAKIAAKLESLEETIIFRLMDRAQYRYNAKTYEPGLFSFVGGGKLSILDHKFRFSEETDAVLGRYSISEERPFYDNLPPVAEAAQRGDKESLHLADYNMINLTNGIRCAYFQLLPTITLEGSDSQYGTTAEYDIAALQAIARRVHFGSFYVAESKYLGDPVAYQAMIDAADRDGLMTALTRIEVEERILVRIAEKVSQIQSISNPEIRRPIDGTIVAKFYEDVIIPLTKEGEVTYLLNRKKA